MAIIVLQIRPGRLEVSVVRSAGRCVGYRDGMSLRDHTTNDSRVEAGEMALYSQEPLETRSHNLTIILGPGRQLMYHCDRADCPVHHDCSLTTLRRQKLKLAQ